MSPPVAKAVNIIGQNPEEYNRHKVMGLEKSGLPDGSPLPCVIRDALRRDRKAPGVGPLSRPVEPRCPDTPVERDAGRQVYQRGVVGGRPSNQVPGHYQAGEGVVAADLDGVTGRAAHVAPVKDRAQAGDRDAIGRPGDQRGSEQGAEGAYQ